MTDGKIRLLTDRDRIRDAFKDLRKLGYFARMNFWCCQTCAWYAVPEDKAEKVVFFHHQDADSFDKIGNLEREMYLAWSGDPQVIIDTLNNHDLIATHDGNEYTRIMVCKKTRP